jgi:Xaa-Pro dipeptidase
MASTAEHLTRTRAAMAAAGVDVLLLGRESNARYVSGAARLWLAGTRPFAPSCVVVGETGAVHLLSVTDDGIPPEVPNANLYPISWNPLNLAAAAADAATGTTVRRVGVDGISPLFAGLLGGVFPDAELVDAEALLRAVRRVKTRDDLTAIRAAVGVADAAFQALLAAAGPGVSAATLSGVFSQRMGELGVTTLAFAPVITIVGDRVAARVGVLRDGWAGVLARTWPGGESLAEAAADVVATVRPGVGVADLRDMTVTVEGLGLGHEELAELDVLEAGMVLFVGIDRHDGCWGDTVLVTDTGAEVLTSG